MKFRPTTLCAVPETPDGCREVGLTRHFRLVSSLAGQRSWGCLRLSSLLVALLLPVVPSQAVVVRSVGGMVNNVAAGAVPGPGVVGNACAHSNVLGGGGANGASAGTVTPAGGASAPIALVDCNVTTPRGWFAGFFMGPIVDAGVGDLRRAKLPAKTVTVSSNSAFAGTVADGRAQWTSVGAGPSALAVSANVVRGAMTPAGTASAEANDPFFLDAGSYAYNPTLTNIELLASQQGEEARLSFDASSSLVGGGGLWELVLRLSGDGGFQFDFASDPRLGLDDGLVEAGLIAALDFSDAGSVRLNSIYQSTGYRLFSSTLTSDRTFDFSDTVRGRASALAEPGTLTLASLMLGSAVVLRRRLKPAPA